MSIAVPECPCRVCGQVMEAKYQKGYPEDRPGHFLLTCWQPGCAMHGYTLSDRNYATRDLTAYLEAGDAVAQRLAERQTAMNPPGARLFG